jgi:uncharacterized protein YoxC
VYCTMKLPVLVAVAITCFCAVASADEKADAYVSKVLTEGWQNFPGAYEKAKGEYETAVPLFPRDSRLHYAMGLVAMRQRDINAASGHFTTAIQANAGDLSAWKAKLWVLAFQGELETTMQGIDRLTSLYPADEADAELEKRLVDAAGWMGRLHGFIAGPASGKIPAQTIQKQAAAIAKRLGGDRLEAFNAGNEQTLAKYRKARDEVNDVVDQESSDAEKKRQLDLKYVEEQRTEASAEREELVAKAAEVKKEAETKIAGLDKQIEPLQKQFMELVEKARPIKRDLRDLEDALDDLVAAAEDGHKSAAGQARRVAAAIDNEEKKLKPIVEEGEKVEKQAMALVQQRMIAVSQYQQFEAATKKKIGSLDHRLRLLDTTRRRLERPADADTETSRAAQQRLRMLASYQTFPLDEERQRLLDSLE